MHLGQGEHVVQFYQKETFLLDAIIEFIRASEASGAPCILIITAAHRNGISQRLLAQTIDPSSEPEAYLALDAASTLAQILENSEPDPQCFTRVISGIINQAAQAEKQIFIFEEMTALLRQWGNHAAALRVESLWSDLCKTERACSVLCAYPTALFSGSEHEKSFTHVCELHTRFIPDESNTEEALLQVRQRAMNLFYQNALTVDPRIAEYRAAEERLHISEERYRRLFETSTDGILIVDPYRGLIVDANPSMLRLLASPREQVVDRQLWQVGLMSDLSGQQAFCQQALQERGTHSEVMSLLRKDGRTRSIEWVSTLFQTDGRAMLQCHLRDITDRLQAEEGLRFLSQVSLLLSSTLDYQQTLANMARLVVPELADWFVVDLIDEHGDLELIEVAHKDPEQVRWARALRERFPPDPNAATGAPRVVRTGKAELHQVVTDAMLAANARNEEELTLWRQVGCFSIMLVPLSARGSIIGVITFIATSSEKRYDRRDLALAEEVGRRAAVALDNARLYRQVQQSRDQLEIILRGVADAILVYSPDSRILYANEAAAQMMGYASVQELLETQQPGLLRRYEIVDEQGKPFAPSQFTHRRVFAGEREAEAIIGSKEAGTEGPKHWALVKSRPVFNERGEVEFVVTIVHDTTELVRLDRRKDEFVNMASHELKNPITNLKGFIETLRRGLKEQEYEQSLHYLKRMDAQIDRLTSLINNMLDVSRMQLGKLKLHMELFAVDALISETVDNVQATTSTHRLLIQGATGMQVLGDKERLGQVFVNLLTNAIKYSPGANTVVVHLSQNEDQIVVDVQDFGIGIDEAQQEKIFERFYQVIGPQEKAHAGLGIGLYVSREIVARHHGRIWVDSSKGNGATFFVALPIAT